MNIHAQGDLSSQPLSVLHEGHRNIERSLQVLREMVGEAPVDGLLSPHKQKLEHELNVFFAMVKRHRMDEEASLFPRLRVDPLAALIIDELERDHQRAESWQQTIRNVGRDWLVSGFQDDVARDKILEAIEELARLGQKHTKIEEQRLFPLAMGRLDEETLRQMAAEMSARHRLSSEEEFGIRSEFA